MAHTIDEVFDNQSFWFGELFNETHTGGFPPAGTRLKNTVNDINAHVNTLLAGVTVDPALEAKIDAIATLLQHVSDGIDTLLDTLNGGHIDNNLDLVIEKVSAMEADTAKIGTIEDEWNEGQHTVLGALVTGLIA